VKERDVTIGYSALVSKGTRYIARIDMGITSMCTADARVGKYETSTARPSSGTRSNQLPTRPPTINDELKSAWREPVNRCTGENSPEDWFTVVVTVVGWGIAKPPYRDRTPSAETRVGRPITVASTPTATEDHPTTEPNGRRRILHSSFPGLSAVTVSSPSS
jgi:hypothetical protein